MVWQPTFKLVRADDHLVLDVTTEGLVALPHTGGPPGAPRFALHPQGQSGLLRLRLPPQQLLEYANDASGNVTPAGKPIFTDPSEIVVRLTSQDPPIPTSVEGILDAARRLPLVVAAAPSQNPDEPGTRLDLPYLLRLRPPNRPLRLVHEVDAAPHGGRVALWSSELVVDPADPSPDRTLRVWFDALTKAANPATSELKLNPTLTESVAKKVAFQSRTVERVEARDLRVSSLGGWADLRGRWPGQNLTELTHKLSMGRDEAQRVGVTGRLMPFGHRAVFTSETLRRFESDESPDEGRRAASLGTEATITVTGRTVDLTARGLPFTSVDITTRATPPGDAVEPADPGDLDGCGLKILMIHGQPFRFAMRATDHAGQLVDFEMPLLFVPDTKPPVPGSDAPPPPITDDEALTVWAGLPSSFTDLALEGQALAVAPPIDDAGALVGARHRRTGRAGPPPIPSVAPVTTVLARTVRLARTVDDGAEDEGAEDEGAADAIGTIEAATITGVVPTLDRFVPGAGVVELSYVKEYLAEGFDGHNKDAQAFLQLAAHQTVGLAQDATGGLASLALPVTAFAREQGAVIGSVEKLLDQKPDLSFLDIGTSLPKLLGIVPMNRLIPSGLDRTMADAPAIVTDVVDGKVTKDLTWTTRLFDPADPSFEFAEDRVVIKPYRPTSNHPEPLLTINQSTTVDANDKQLLRSRTEVTLTGFELQILTNEGGTVLVAVPFERFSFVATDGTKPDVDVALGALRFGGILSYLGRLMDLIDVTGFNDPPALVVTEDSVKSSFSFPVPSIAIGMFTLQNINIGAELEIFFKEQAPTLFVNFSSAADPFQLTVSALGGGGYLQLGVSTDGLERIEGALEFGAAAALDIIIASVSVEAMGGVRFFFDAQEGVAIDAYLRIRGHVDVASLISADIMLLLILTYQSAGNLLIGHGELVLQIKVLFFSESLRVSVTRKFAGSNSDPTFAELMAPAGTTGSTPWDIYCTAFVED